MNPKHKLIRKDNISEILFAAIIIIGAITMLIPFAWMISASLKTNTEFYEATRLIPSKPQWDNYLTYFTNKQSDFPIYFFNTVRVTTLNTVGAVISCSLAAFALARIRFTGSRYIFGLALASMFLPSQVTTIPIFILMNKIGWYNTHLALVVPAFFGNAFGIFLLRQFFKSIPGEIEDAAKIDGCGWFRIYCNIGVPFVRPALITLAIMQFQSTWGEILRPLIYLSNSKLYTLTVGIRQLTQQQYRIDYGTQMAGYFLLILPVMVIYIICQRYFTQSIASAGLKG